MPESPKAGGKLESIQATINIARDGLFLIVILMLLALPGTVNRILTEAGFTRASILGFEWEEKMKVAAQQTEEAKQEVERLKDQLGAYASQIDQVAQAVSLPNVRTRAEEIAQNVRSSQATAAGLGTRLANNLVAQQELRSELKRRIR